MKNKYSFKMRSAAFITVILLIMSLFLADLFRIQVVLKDEYADKKVALSSANTRIDALRGEILDSNGTPLVYNVKSNSVYIDASYFPKASEQEKRTKIILALIRLFDEKGVEYNSRLPIMQEGNGFVYTENSDSDKKYLFRKHYLNLNSYATAVNCYDALVEYYSLEELSTEDALKVAGVFFAMTRADFSTANPFTIAENVPDETVMILKEQSRFYEGIEIRVDTDRAFYDGTLAPHILGYYDFIDADEYKSVSNEYKEALKDESLTDEQRQELSLKSYGMTDKIGKFGVESAMEKELRGTKGISTTLTNADGSKITQITKEPVNGSNVILTINADFQKKVQEILKARVDSTKDKANVAAAASIVVMDVSDFSVLACATYPTYDLSTYKENQAALNADESAPLWNRALRSTYEPGSTVKPAVGFAGLEEGIITPNSTIQCNTLYTYFKDSTFRCFTAPSTHAGRHLTLSDAIKWSCNTYFFEVGRQLSIDRIGSYFAEFGLGQKTGVELTEATGAVASPERRQAMGGVWYPGNTVQAAIGQSDHQFTPIQLCAYTATLANGGNRYKAHFVKSIKSADYSETLYEAQPELIHKIDASATSFQAVRDGMIAMADTSRFFSKLDYKVAAKTGTAEAKKRVNGQLVEYTNGLMISYAPADNPKIAVAIVVENVMSSGMAQYITDVYNAYFSLNSGVTESQQDNTLLN